jgi:hypothetical protein
MGNIDPQLHYIYSFITYLCHCKKRAALRIALDLRHYKAPAVTYLFPIIYYSSAMLICCATPNGCVGALLGANVAHLHIFFLAMGYQM